MRILVLGTITGMSSKREPRTVVFARQSRDLRGEAAAVTRQIELSMRLIRERGLGDTLEPIVENDVSASKGPRKGYAELLRLIESGRVDTVVAYHLDRLLRSMVDLEELITLCEQTGVRIMTVFGELDLSTDMGRLVGRILASVARGEVERKGARQRDAARQSAEAGEPPDRGAFGHPRNVRVKNKPKPVPAEQIEREREAVRNLYTGLLSGKSLITLTRELNDAELWTTRGKRWHPSSVRFVLMNPRNAGLRYLHGERTAKGNWERIVPEETWQAAVQLLTDPARRNNPGSGRRWLGGGLYLCGKCDESAVKVNYRHDPRSREPRARTYRCRKYLHNTRMADRIDAYVREVIAERLRQPDVLRLLAGPDRAEEAAALAEEGTALRKRIEQLADDLAIDERTLARRDRALRQRVAEIDDELARIGSDNRLSTILSAHDPGQAFLDETLDVQRVTIAAVCTVTLLPNSRGRLGVLSDTIRIDPR